MVDGLVTDEHPPGTVLCAGGRCESNSLTVVHQ